MVRLDVNYRKKKKKTIKKTNIWKLNNIVFNFIQNNFVRLYSTAAISACIFKKLIEFEELFIVTVILKMEEKKEHFQHIILYYFKKG